MSYPDVYLIRIYDRPWGFRVVAVVARDEDAALDYCRSEYAAQTESRHKSCFAQVEDRCCTDQLGNSATFTFQE